MSIYGCMNIYVSIYSNTNFIIRNYQILLTKHGVMKTLKVFSISPKKQITPTLT